MNPYLQAMLMRAAQRGDDQVLRAGTPGVMSIHQLGALADPGIYGPGGLGGLGGGVPVMPRPSSDPGYRQLGQAQHVMQGLQQGQDVNLTGSGFELSPQQLMGGGPPTSFDMLQQYLRPPGVFGAMNNLGALGGWQ